MLELKVKVININLSSGHKLLEQCKPIYEYSWLIQRIKDYLTEGRNRDEAIIQAVKDCKEKGILVEFVQKYGSEAINMLYTQFNLEDAKEVWQEEAYEDGLAEGELLQSRQSIFDFLEDLGEIPEDIRSRIDTEENREVLKKWLKAAAHVQDFESFRDKMA